MKVLSGAFLRLSFLTLLTVPAHLANGPTLIANAQEPPKTQSDDVLRVNTDLVQTTITVLDKKGRFVDGLERGQFELLGSASIGAFRARRTWATGCLSTTPSATQRELQV